MKSRFKHKSKPKGFLAQHRVKIVVGVLALMVVVFVLMQPSSPPKAKQLVSTVSLLAPPPPPPPPPPTPPPPAVKQMVPQEAVKDEAKPDNSKPLDTGALGKSGSFHVAGGTGNGGGGGGGSLWGWYASGVQNTIKQALSDNPRTRHAAMGITVRIWPDVTGRITRVELVNSTGDASLDSTIKDQVLNGLALPEGPPEGMPMPINLRISAHP